MINNFNSMKTNTNNNSNIHDSKDTISFSRMSIKSNTYINREECEKRMFERFPILNDDKVVHNYFCSYDFHENEEYMIEFWRDVLGFIYESIKDNFGIRTNEILELSKIKNRRPLGLPNIIVRIHYITIYSLN